MELIKGFRAAERALSRKAVAASYEISPALKSRLEEMFGDGDPEAVVKQIINQVRDGGDQALLDLTKKIDGVGLKSLAVSKEAVAQAYKEVDADLVSLLEVAAGRIRAFHQRQLESLGGGFSVKGAAQLKRPLERVGVYAPGGHAAYPSTVLMTAIPARVAGVKEIILATAPKAGGQVPPLTLVAADIAGVDGNFSVGGAQAIAALAYGTASFPKVDKICGPGNLFVVLAKKMVYGAVAIDGLQGPSEVLVIADDKADVRACAADLLAQAEHDSLAQMVLVTTSQALAEAIMPELERQLNELPQRDIANESIKAGGKIAVVANLEEAIALANLYAPEHLLLMVENAANYTSQIHNAGCVFLGGKATVALGDYVAGPSHVLPTGGTARFTSPLSVADFIKLISVVDLDEETLLEVGPVAVKLARAEGFEAHARAVERRLAEE